MNERMLVGTRKGLFQLRPGSGPGGWEIDRVDFLGEPVSMLLSDPARNMVYASLTLGHFGVKLHRSADGGQTWEECAVPVYPAGATIAQPGPPADPDDPNPAPPKQKPASLAEIWSLEAGDDGTLWAGTIPGGLFRSSDQGSSWSLVEGLWNRPERAMWFGGGKDEPGIHSICIDPRDGNSLLAAVSCAGVWGTTDGGETWEQRGQGMRAEFMPPERAYDPEIQDPHLMVRCPSSPDHLWIQHHNGIFRSVDNSRSWTEITAEAPSRFGFAVAVHPHDPETAWFVPAVKDECRVPVDGRLVVTRTRDGGQTLEVLSDGLPQQHAYDLIYRHALAIDATGEQLVLGSTTGGLWSTTNGGDRWECVSSTMPPVYCIRFG